MKRSTGAGRAISPGGTFPSRRCSPGPSRFPMIYFLLGAALAALLDADARKLLRKREPWVALAIGAVVIAPNLLWNLRNGLVTFGHTRSVVNAEQTLGLHPEKALEFVAAQFAV